MVTDTITRNGDKPVSYRKRQANVSKFRGDRFEELIQEFGYTQEELANLLGVGQNTIHRWKTGKTDPSTDTLDRLADLFRTSADYLIGRSAAKHPKQTSALNGVPGNDPKHKESLTPDEYRLVRAYRAGDNGTLMRLLSEKIAQAFRDDPSLTEDE